MLILITHKTSPSAVLCQRLLRYSWVPQPQPCYCWSLRTRYSCFVQWSVVQWHVQKPNLLALNECLSHLWLWTNFQTTFSNCLAVVDKGLVGSFFFFWCRVGSLPAFDKPVTSAFWQGPWKCDTWKQLRCMNDLETCLRYSILLLSRP